MDFLRDDIAEALRTAPKRKRTKRYEVRAGEDVHPVLRLWDNGFTVAETDTPHMRGFVDIFLNDERQARCLIICAEIENNLVHYEFKRRTEDSPQAPADFVLEDDRPVALLT